MLEIKHLRKEYENATPLEDVCCTVMPGEVISLIGPSGTGKSTLLRCINGLETPTSGEIIYNGKNILAPGTDKSEIRKHIGMVFQSFNLFPHLTALQNVMIPQMQLLGRTKQEAYDKAAGLLKQVGLYDRAANYPSQLSGGQKQRVAIARTLAMDNDIILLDEPTSALDPAMVGEVESVIQSLTKTGITMLIVTHEMRFARAVSSRVFFMNEGVIFEDGTPEQIFGNPQKDQTRRFIFGIKETSVELESRYCDYYSCMTELSRFAERSYLSRGMTDAVLSVFEELVVIHMLPKMADGDRMRVSMSASDRLDEVTLTVYHTMDFDADRDVDEISAAIIKHRADSIVTADSQDEKYKKQIVMKLKKE